MKALDPDVVVRSNGAEAVRGAVAVAGRTSGFARFAQVNLPALVDGAVGMVIAADGRPITLTVFTITGIRVAAIDIIDNPERVAEADLTILDWSADTSRPVLPQAQDPSQADTRQGPRPPASSASSGQGTLLVLQADRPDRTDDDHD